MPNILMICPGCNWTMQRFAAGTTKGWRCQVCGYTERRPEPKKAIGVKNLIADIKFPTIVFDNNTLTYGGGGSGGGRSPVSDLVAQINAFEAYWGDSLPGEALYQ
ncbi:hypothetical protein MINTM005_13140 [Mycobacterium intracellulare]|uniref:hypothetical protein n=1 Tax=Mycobacterium intracellulare TaxID=1767 RepID=UPI001925C13F|nr:hypothetical protein [Mycobacterium intracellulare]BCO56070.1 hypothetical protein MINTM005_13140 [Mycobacterium intracellulare]